MQGELEKLGDEDSLPMVDNKVATAVSRIDDMETILMVRWMSYIH